MSLLEEVGSVNARSEISIFDNQASTTEPQCPFPGLLSEVLQYDPETVEAALGATGRHIRAFAESADLRHPDLANIADGRLVANSDFSQIGGELLKFAQFAREQSLPIVVQNFPKLFARNDSHGFVSLRISDPVKNSCNNVRFVGSREKREAIRARKTSQDMTLYGFYQNKVESWETLPGSFVTFVRNSTPYGEDIALLARRVLHFEQVGLKSSAARMRERLDSLQAAVAEQYYGFNRCPINAAVVILAKLHGFVLGNIRSPKSIVRRIHAGEEMVKSILDAGFFTSIGVEYQPRLYVAGSLQVPSRMQRIMDHLDAFPEAAGKPIFDHFCVLMPSLTKGQDESMAGCDTSAKSRDMDQKLIAAGLMCPILLGECDGKQYFIDYWS